MDYLIDLRAVVAIAVGTFIISVFLMGPFDGP